MGVPLVQSGFQQCNSELENLILVYDSEIVIGMMFPLGTEGLHLYQEISLPFFLFKSACWPLFKTEPFAHKENE